MVAEFFTIVSTINTGIEIYEASKKVQSKVKMFYKYLTDGKVNVVFFGPGGVGKTTLALFLTDNDNFRKPEYIESGRDEKIKIGKNIIGNYWVAPGQTRRIEKYWPQIYRAISAGKTKIIINIVSYGYHSIEQSITSHKELKDYYKSGMNEERFIKVYLEKRREEEIRIINELKHRIKDTKVEIKMITLVTKQDIWWNEREIVKEYYLKGDYNEAIDEIIRHKGASHFEHSYISTSLLSNNFKIGTDINKNVTEGYDESIRISNNRNLLNQLEAFLK